MLTAELDFDLPERFIAQTPTEPRDAARLLALKRSDGSIQHYHVRDLPALLQAGDLLVFNDTRVLRARLRGHKIVDGQNGARVEALLLKEEALNQWQALLKPSQRLRVGSEVVFEGGGVTISARLLARNAETWSIAFSPTLPLTDVREALPQLGEVPLPPYIHQTATEERYQTTFVREEATPKPLDSAAAPTAGLHFTPELLERLRSQGIETAFVTLAVGIGTFRPVQSEVLEEHTMHTEEFWISEEAAQQINTAKSAGRRVIAVGTTTVRTLESAVDEDGTIRAGDGETALFLRPGAKFKIVDGLMTNFHLPRSTLLALVSAFIEAPRHAENANGENRSSRELKATPTEESGLEMLLRSYQEAMQHNYRFFSFGDAMFID